MPSLVQLQYALSVEKHRHFGRAAEACRITQPTLSQQLQKLEDELGVILFDRARKPILATPEGQRFLAQARVVLREQEKLMQVAEVARGGELSGEFRLGVIPTVASELLPLWLEAFAERFPCVQLLIEELKTATILSELAADRLDAAILATPVEDSSLKIHPLYYEAFYAYFAEGHELLKRASVARADLDAAQMWLLQDGHCFKDQVLRFCAMPGTGEAALGNVRFQSGSLDTLCRLVRRGHGYTLVPELMVLGMGKVESRAHVRPFRVPAPTREISLIYRRDHWKLAIMAAIERTVEEMLPRSIARKSERGMKVLDVC